jgi:hypothetical protein
VAAVVLSVTVLLYDLRLRFLRVVAIQEMGARSEG